MTLDPYLTLYPKINSKEELKSKLLEENIEVSFHGLGLWNSFLDMILKAQETTEKIDKIVLHTHSHILCFKDTINNSE